MSEATKLTVYFGERARADGGFLSDALVGAFARHRVATSLVLRGVEGFGAKHALRTDRLLSLSEDLPMVAVAVDAPDRIAGVWEEVRALPRFGGLVTRERARLLPDAGGPDRGAAKLTVYLGRRERAGGRAAYLAVVDLLARLGIAGATVILGVDGTRWGQRERARLLGRNAQVPLMVIAVGDGSRVADAATAVTELLDDPLVTLERVRIGALVAAPPGGWVKIMAYSSDRDRHRALVAELRGAGAPGATTVRGMWGYHGATAPHGDRVAQWHRRVPLLTTVLDRPGDEAARSFAVVRRVFGRDGLVTCEVVPPA